jgi:uncharacterized repeat protein (TIGR01451 family)
MIKIGLILMFTLMSFTSLAELKGEMKAFKVESIKGVEKKQIANEVNNGDIIEYEITYKNMSSEALTNVSIKGVIHPSTDIIMGTQTLSPVPVFSLDAGKTWSLTPIIRTIENGEIVTKNAPSTAYVSLKWDIELFNGKEERVFVYRVKVKED